MKLLQGLGSGLCLTVLCLLAAPKATADEWDHKTVLTFSGPVEVPGVGQHILPAGTYVFKLVESSSDRHIVQIFNQDQTQVLTTILAIPNYRLKATDKTVITFRERPAGEPEALKAWFYPSHEWGEEFVYGIIDRRSAQYSAGRGGQPQRRYRRNSCSCGRCSCRRGCRNTSACCHAGA